MAVEMYSFTRPYEVQKLIDLGSGQDDLYATLATINADVATKLPYVCPQCVGGGRVMLPVNNVLVQVECPTCYGWGATEAQVEVQRSFSPKQNVPTSPNV